MNMTFVWMPNNRERELQAQSVKSPRGMSEVMDDGGKFIAEGFEDAVELGVNSVRDGLV
jgi:hypothetical protein